MDGFDKQSLYRKTFHVKVEKIKFLTHVCSMKFQHNFPHHHRHLPQISIFYILLSFKMIQRTVLWTEFQCFIENSTTMASHLNTSTLSIFQRTEENSAVSKVLFMLSLFTMFLSWVRFFVHKVWMLNGREKEKIWNLKSQTSEIIDYIQEIENKKSEEVEEKESLLRGFFFCCWDLNIFFLFYIRKKIFFYYIQLWKHKHKHRHRHERSYWEIKMKKINFQTVFCSHKKIYRFSLVIFRFAESAYLLYEMKKEKS